MTPVPRGLLRTCGALALLAAALYAAAGPAHAEEGPTCHGLPAVLVDAPPGTAYSGTPGDDVVLGTAGDDVIYGLGGNDTICAGGGNDLVVGGRGNDTVFGEGGDDTIFGNLGNDTLSGGDGFDQVSGDPGRDSIDGGEGTDLLYGGGGPDTIDGAAGNDKLYGEAGRDRLNGGEGNDQLYGEGEPDRLFGGNGNDELQGGAGDDFLFGEGGGDFLWGDEGADVLIGGAGDDLLQGGPGADNLLGWGGFDELWGGECGDLAGAVHCRRVPSGRPEGDPDTDPGDIYNGGPALDACNEVDPWSPVILPAGCDTYRGERGGPRFIETSEEWWPQIEQAFNERALVLLEGEDPLKQEYADALLAEVTHAKQVAACESLGDVFEMTFYGEATSDGLFQHRSTYWADRALAADYAGASVFDPLANARVTAWMVAEDIEYYWVYPNRLTDRLAWDDWSCDYYIDVVWDLWEPYP